MAATENGLIVLRFVKGAGGYYVGDLAGFVLAIAAEYVKAGSAVYVDPEDDPGLAPGDVMPAEKLAEIAARKAADSDDATVDADGLVAIPEGWESLHGNKRKSIAAKIAGAPVASVEEADAVIAAEVQRRAA